MVILQIQKIYNYIITSFSTITISPSPLSPSFFCPSLDWHVMVGFYSFPTSTCLRCQWDHHVPEGRTNACPCRSGTRPWRCRRSCIVAYTARVPIARRGSDPQHGSCKSAPSSGRNPRMASWACYDPRMPTLASSPMMNPWALDPWIREHPWEWWIMLHTTRANFPY